MINYGLQDLGYNYVVLDDCWSRGRGDDGYLIVDEAKFPNGMLAVSEEDRPFMPVTTVVLEGVPRDMKVLFRHWDDKLIPAAGLMSGKLGRGKSLRIVGLEKAIEATRR